MILRQRCRKPIFPVITLAYTKLKSTSSASTKMHYKYPSFPCQKDTTGRHFTLWKAFLYFLTSCGIIQQILWHSAQTSRVVNCKEYICRKVLVEKYVKSFYSVKARNINFWPMYTTIILYSTFWVGKRILERSRT